MVFLGVALPVEHEHLKVSPLGLAGGVPSGAQSPENAELHLHNVTVYTTYSSQYICTVHRGDS